MSTTRNTLLASLKKRLGGLTTVWPDGDLESFLDDAITGLYPTYYKRMVNTTTAAAGPIQTPPSGCKNLYMVQIKRQNSNRPRPARNWIEGDSGVSIPRTNISGDQLIWAWTEGWDAPTNGTATIDIPLEAEEVVILRAHVAALEELLTTRIGSPKYHALQVREGVTESEVIETLEALHASLRHRLEQARPLPEEWR